jgi:hypothetical protein
MVHSTRFMQQNASEIEATNMPKKETTPLLKFTAHPDFVGKGNCNFSLIMTEITGYRSVIMRR